MKEKILEVLREKANYYGELHGINVFKGNKEKLTIITIHG